MSFFEELDREGHQMLASLFALSRDNTLINGGANAVELGNYSGYRGVEDLVKRGYADVRMRKVEGLPDEKHYRISDKGKRLLERLIREIKIDS
tara:strand:+ start:1027 stop:1305 length:279 start_codon:yes stop_codon:yes gene_type:complete